jgi:hypothetical protein
MKWSDRICGDDLRKISNEGIGKWSSRHVLSSHISRDEIPNEPNEKQSDKNLDNHHVPVKNKFAFFNYNGAIYLKLYHGVSI